MELSRYERETVIVYNDAEPYAELYTCSKPVMRRMDALVCKSALFTVIKEDEISKTYKFPKKYARVRKPPSARGIENENGQGNDI